MADTIIDARLRPIIRLFVSSTFSDLKLERDTLQKRVFPKLEQLCLKAGFQFQAIDLRWGVSTEAGLDHRTMRICFEELRRSQEISPAPNFLILLGNRYGWRPLPEEISAEEFRSLEVAARQIAVVDQHPPLVEVLYRWYRLDENSLTPVYIFQPRRKPKEGDSGSKDYTTAEVWSDVEQALWQIINRAFPVSGLKNRFAASILSDVDSDRSGTLENSGLKPTEDFNDTDRKLLPSIVRFQASATEQEIWCGALRIANASQHVLAFFREIDPPQDIENAETIKDYFDLQSGKIDSLAQDAQRDLKTEIKNRLGGNCIELPHARLSLGENQSGQQAASVSTDHIDELCREVETRLTTIIERQIKEYWRESKPSSTESDKSASAEQRNARELEIERDEHLRFSRERGPKEAFVGRQDQLQKILDYVYSDSSQPLVIHGASGCGKTALMARAAGDIPDARQPIIRFIGVTPQSSDLRSLLRSLCQELRQRNPIEAAIPSETRELIDEFRKHLHAATAEQPVIMFLDALDQLAESDNSRQLFWIPSGQLPSHVKIVVSCLSDRDKKDPVAQPFIALQRRKLPARNMISLDALSLDDAKTLLFNRWLPAAGRTLAKTQRRLIERRLESKVCRQPLYLKLLFEEVKLWRWYDEQIKWTSSNREGEALAAQQATDLGDGVPALLEQLFNRLSQPEHHGESLVRLALGYLSAARRGLSETEFLEVLFSDPDYKHQLDEASQRNNHQLPTEPARIPIAIWSRLRSDLAPYLTERAAPGGNVLTLYHRQIAEWVKFRFVEQNDVHRKAACKKSIWQWIKACFVKQSDWQPHKRLATYFQRQQAWGDRKLDEFPWQLAAAHEWQQLHDTLTSQPCFLGLYQRNEYELLAYWLQLKPRFNLAASYVASFKRWSQENSGDSDMIFVANQLAGFLRTVASYPEAETLMRWVLATTEKRLGVNHPDVGTALNNLAVLLYSMNRLPEVEPLYERALTIAERSFGLYHPEVAVTLNNWAKFLQLTNRVDDAEPLLRRAQGIFEKSLGEKHANTAAVLNSRGQLLRAKNKLAEAELLFRRALAIDEQTFGQDHPGVTTYLNNLAELLQATNRVAEAESLYRRALAINEHTFGRDHPDVAVVLSNLAKLLYDTESFAEAEPLMRRALKIDEQYLGSNHPIVAIRLNNLGQLLQATNRKLEAESLMRRALAIDEHAYGPDHPDVARELNNLGLLLFDTARFIEAEPMYRRALTIWEKSLGPNHPEVASALNNLAVLLQRTNRLAEAEPLSRRLLTILLDFTIDTEHQHPHLHAALGNYEDLLLATGLSKPKVRRRLNDLLEKYGMSME